MRVAPRSSVTCSLEISDTINVDDEVLMIFNEQTNSPVIDATNIDNVLSLDNGHSWLDGTGRIGGFGWNPGGTVLSVMLSTGNGPPSISVGDSMTPQGDLIVDTGNNPATGFFEIGGSFDPPVGIGDEGPIASMPRALQLSQNYPNPFNPSTSIALEVPPGVAERTSLIICDMRGRFIRRLVDDYLAPGSYTFHWDAKDGNGDAASSGSYICKLESGGYSTSRELLMLK